MDATTLDLVRIRREEDSNAGEALYRYMTGKHAPNGMDSESMMSQIGG